MTSGVLMDAVTSGVLMDAGERPGGTGEPAYYRPPITVRGKPRSPFVTSHLFQDATIDNIKEPRHRHNAHAGPCVTPLYPSRRTQRRAPP